MVLLSPLAHYEKDENNEAPELKAYQVKESIGRAFEIQRKRFELRFENGGNGSCDFNRNDPDFRLSEAQEEWLKDQQKQHYLSFRRVTQVIRVARTIADLEGIDAISENHLKEAWRLRCFDLYQLS